MVKIDNPFQSQEHLHEAVAFLQDSMIGFMGDMQTYLREKRTAFSHKFTEPELEAMSVDLMLRATTFALINLHKIAGFSAAESIKRFVDAYNQYESAKCSDPDCPLHNGGASSHETKDQRHTN